MRNILTLLSAAALLAVPTAAQARGLDSNFSQAVTGPIKLEIVVSEDLAHRANNLPKKISQRGSRTRLNATFSGNGKYGEREIDFLINDLEEELLRDFDKRGIVLSDTAPTILRVTIEKVKNNRPTFNQLKEDTNLSFTSFGTGGAELTANVTTTAGEVLGEAEYNYYSSFNDRPIQGRSVWSDTSRAFASFSKQYSKKLARAGAAAS